MQRSTHLLYTAGVVARMPADCTIYVGGLPPTATQSSLIACFAPLSATSAVICRSFGFVTFASAELALQAAQRRDLQIDGQPCHAAPAHSKLTASGGARPPRRPAAGSSRSIFVSAPKQHAAPTIERLLGNACADLTSEGTRVCVPRKQGGAQPPQHRGFAFVECASAPAAAAVLAGLLQLGWRAEPVRAPKGRAGAKKKGAARGKSRGRRGRRSRAVRQGDADEEEEYEDDFEEEAEDDAEDETGRGGGWSDATFAAEAAAAPDVATMVVAAAAAASPAEEEEEATPPSSEMAALGLAEVGGDGNGGGSGGGQGDACVRAMAAFVAESREWALGVQGFLLQHCRSFEDVEENRLEWTELHAQLRGMMEQLLEEQLAQLGVSVDDFVDRLASCPASRAGNDLLETVLAMDDFGSFKQHMLRLKRDLDLLNLPTDTLDAFAGRT